MISKTEIKTRLAKNLSEGKNNDGIILDVLFEIIESINEIKTKIDYKINLK